MAGEDEIPAFNPFFLVYFIVASILAIFFLLYFNRLFASIVSYFIRTWTWHRYRVYIDIQALQISLLGGRVFFTGLRYHGNNETILVQNGHITWCYWLRRVREAGVMAKCDRGTAAGNSAAVNPGKKTENLPCRITVSLVGVEWFVYNRSAAYDSVLDGLTGGISQNSSGTLPGDEPQSKLRKRRSKQYEKASDADAAGGRQGAEKEVGDSGNEKASREYQARRGASLDTYSSSGGHNYGHDAYQPGPTPELPLMIQLFPIHIQCTKAAMVMGNDNTKAVLIVKAESLSGEIDALATQTPDPYRQIFKFKFNEPVVEMRDNEDYKEDQAARAARQRQAAQEQGQDTTPITIRSWLKKLRRRSLGKLRSLVPYWRRSVESFSLDSRSALGTAASQLPGQSHWQGLSRYIDERDQDDKTRWSSVEYAAVSTIVDSPGATLSIFWDVPGKVGLPTDEAIEKEQKSLANINGDEPPAWGINLSINGGSVNYGPWADRQRAELQRVFFPGLCKDAVPIGPLPPGSDRMPTQFKLYIELDDEVTVRIPIREESKNWRWKGKEPPFKAPKPHSKRRHRARNKKASAGEGTQLRPAGWLDVKVASNATISYSMDMLASASGYANTLSVDLPGTELSSSVNHETLWRSGRQRITCDLSAPLAWNGLRSWYFNVIGEDLELFLLRDHVFLLIDLVDDWASGPPPEYLVFTPFKYHMNLDLRNLKLFLNVNDANIINNPIDLDDNTYLILKSPALLSTACIPIDKYRPNKNMIPFDVKAETLDVSFHVPPWNTQESFVSSKEIGRAENLVVNGQYHYNATTSPANTDTLVLDVKGQSPRAYLYGFIVRYFLKIKDNYFGDDVHFRTLEEYQQLLSLKEKNPGAELATRPPHKSNDLDVILTVKIDNPTILLPANLYSSQKHIQVDLASLEADLRFTNYNMDLDLILSPLSLTLGNENSGMETPIATSSNTQLFIDGVHVYGHRLFGLPPPEPTYLCNWDLSVGAVTGECTADFLGALIRGGQAFAFSFDDDENALISYSSIIFYDITFLRVMVESVRLWLHIEEAAVLLSTGTIDVDFNDWARSHYSKRADINIPDLELCCVDSESAARHKARSQHQVETDAFVKTSIRLAVIGRKFQFFEERKLQQQHVRREDQRTHRTEFLLLPGVLDELIPDQVDVPAQCVPPVPLPATAEDVAPDQGSLRTGTDASSLKSSRRLRPKSSFLSFTSSSESSIVRPRSSTRSHSKSKRSSGHQSELRGLTPSRPGMHRRELSASTSRHSAFYSAVGDIHPRENVQHSSVAFASQYFAPYFPLEGVRPDTREATLQSIEADEDDIEQDEAEFTLDDIDPESLGVDHIYASTLVEFPSGITAFFNPTAVKSLTMLATALQPKEPEDMLDTLQVSSMGEIFDLKKLVKITGEIKDLQLRVPRANIRFLNSSTLDSPDPNQEERDQYDLTISQVALMTRSTTTWENPFKTETKHERTSLHLRLGSTELSASERLSTFDNAQAAVVAQVERVMVSMGSKDVTYLDVDVGSVSIRTASGKIEYLASLIHRTNMIVDELGSVVANMTERHAEQLKCFTARLLNEGKGTVDPSFLIRPSAVLRAAPEHLRTFDSWKLAIRLRQIWSGMDINAKAQASLTCLGPSIKAPTNVKEDVIAAFQRWRSWDLHDLSESVLLKNIFGPLKETPESDDIPLMAAVRLREIELVLDRGNVPKQNRIAILDVIARLERKTNPAENPDPGPADNIEGRLATLNVFCGEAHMSLNWELCELANDVLELYSRSWKGGEPPTPDSEVPVKKASKPRQPLHVVLELERGSLEIDTINLIVTSLTGGLKTSLILGGGDGHPESVNFILSCAAITSRLHHRSHLLGMFQLHEPSIFLSHELQETAISSEHTIKATASSRSFSLAVKQDPVMLLEVVDLLVKDEAAQLHQLGQLLPPSPQPKPRDKKIVERLSAFRVNVAMFLDEYHISLPLLRSITYNISGVVARAAIAANFGKELIFDFDIKENSHEIQMDVRNEIRSISLLRIPPTNGRVTSHISETEHSIAVFASLELMQLDASAVYSLLRAMNRPQISSTLNDIKDQMEVVKSHIEEVFGTTDPSSSQQEEAQKANFVYNVHLTLAGMEIFGKTPLKSETEPLAVLSFNLDRVHLEIANRSSPHGPILATPELHVNLQQILFDIQRGREGAMRSCGNISFGILLSATSRHTEDGIEQRAIRFRSDGLAINLSPETISTFIDAIGYMGDRIKDLDTSKELEYLRRLRQSRPRIAINDEQEAEEPDIIDSFLSSITYHFEVRDIRLCWLVPESSAGSSVGKEDLVLSIHLIEFGTRKQNSARLTIANFQLQMVPPGQDKSIRSLHSALLPEVVFNIAYVSTSDARRLAFQAVGKSLDLRLTSGFIIPAANLQDSISLSVKNVQQASQHWNTGIPVSSPKADDAPRRSILGTKRLESLLIDAEFAGAVVYISSKKPADFQSTRSGRPSAGGKYGQFNTDESGTSALLRSPGLAWKLEYRDDGKLDPTLYGEVKIEASSNVLYPSVVPLIMDMTASVKEVVSEESDEQPTSPLPPALVKSKSGNEDNILTADPSAVLGRLRLNLGLRICRQEFSLSCQPIARVEATAAFDDVYFTVSTVYSKDLGNFFAISGAFTNLEASVKHVYSRESTGSFGIESIVLSLMNSKHVSGTSGVSAILKVSPMKVSINAKQLQDFLLFREIWYPSELQQGTAAPVAKLVPESSQVTQGHLVQRYQEVAATAAFPWTATISIESLEINVDLGQAIGKSVFAINNFWISSKKTSDWEQNLCLGFDKIGVDCTGRLSGFVALQSFKLRTSIQWPEREQALNETPLIQASIGFSQFRLKAAFDYQAFLVADITTLEFLMYNVRRSLDGSGDRLVAILDGQAVQIFGTTTSAAQAIALYQALQKLMQERKSSFETSLREIEKFMKRQPRGSVSREVSILPKLPEEEAFAKSPISLDTDVVVTLKALNLGVFPSTFSDHQVFKMEALDAQARFAASIDQRQIHSILDLTLGQLRIGLAGVRNIEAPKTLSEISVEDVVQRATGSRGGTILKVPKVEAIMQTWQTPDSNRIDYIFKSAFEGKVEVGWNYSRISYIRGMWANHSKTLAQTWGKELPMTAAIKVTGVPEPDSEGGGSDDKKEGEAGKITAEVNVPQSRYDYVALEPPIIETPQLRDMGEATPPLEWIGLHRDRLPNLTHQIVIVSLLELAGEVEDAYSRILGSS